MAKFYRINEYIRTSKLRIIDAEGNQIGILTKAEALEKAKSSNLDLVEVAPDADPPVARILDFQKFKYQEAKKERVARRGAVEVELKELWLSPRIADHDLQVRLNRAEEFLNEGNKVKLTVKFRGREMVHPEAGHQVIKKALGHFGEKMTVERESKFEGRNLSVIIARGRGKSEELKGVDRNVQVKTKNTEIN